MSSMEFENGEKIKGTFSSMATSINTASYNRGICDLEVVFLISKTDSAKISSYTETKDFLIKAVNVDMYSDSNRNVNILEKDLRYEGSFIVSAISFNSNFDYITIISNSYKKVEVQSKLYILKQKINKIKQHIGGI